MENCIYERDYTEAHEQNRNTGPNMIERLIDTGFFKYYNALMQQIPKVILPKDKAAYERILKGCDDMAKRHGGKIFGIVSYEKWESWIRLTLPFIEFSSDEDVELLRDIADNAHTVCFQPMENGYVQLSIMICYFEEIPVPDEAMLDIARKALRKAGVDKQSLLEIENELLEALPHDEAEE